VALTLALICGVLNLGGLKTHVCGVWVTFVAFQLLFLGCVALLSYIGICFSRCPLL
jgi:hypothetical protein